MNSEPFVLVLYYSRQGATHKMANLVARGVEKVHGISAKVVTVPPVATETQICIPPVPEQGPPYVTLDDLNGCSGLIIGSPTRFGNMAAPLKHFLDTTGALWGSGALINKPAGVFTSTASLHGGQESTLLSMMLPLIHHGCIIVGVPYSEAALNQTTAGGTPYGPSHFSGVNHDREITREEAAVCLALGSRIATLALKL